ncbi:MAG: tyrosine-type recombinase/integrase [Alistipes sp.]|nr:tyrosine-type recombinase/integrase [Candidatus Minthomonas equi]
MMTTIGYSVKKEKWNANKQIVKSGYVNHKGQTSEEINERLLEIRERFRQYEKSIREKPTIEDMKHILSYQIDPIPKSEDKSAAEWVNSFIKEESLANQWTKGTAYTFLSMKKHIEAHCGRKPLEYFNDDGMQSFLNYLRYDCKMMESTIRKEYKCLKWFLNWSVRKRLISDKNLFQTRPKLKILEQPVIYLTKEELMRLYKLRFQSITTSSRRMEAIRDMFCFCAFTSLRYSDMIRLKTTDIIHDILYTTTQKTNDLLPINLNSFSKAILSKYCKTENKSGEYVFPRITNVEMNRKLKKICELAGINTPVTKVYVKGGVRIEDTRPKYKFIGTHTGRKTFICFALASGIPPQIVMKWTGHSDYAAMRPYIEIAESAKVENMAFIEKKLKE